jgi:hypothetical protein
LTDHQGNEGSDAMLPSEAPAHMRAEVEEDERALAAEQAAVAEQEPAEEPEPSFPIPDRAPTGTPPEFDPLPPAPNGG